MQPHLMRTHILLVEFLQNFVLPGQHFFLASGFFFLVHIYACSTCDFSFWSHHDQGQDQARRNVDDLIDSTKGDN